MWCAQGRYRDGYGIGPLVEGKGGAVWLQRQTFALTEGHAAEDSHARVATLKLQHTPVQHATRVSRWST